MDTRRIGRSFVAVACALAAVAAVQNRPSFDDEFRRLREGPRFTAQPSGLVRLSEKSADGVEHYFAVTIPEGYDPARKYPVRIHLHGGVMMRRSNVPPPNSGGIGALAGAGDWLYIVPFAWEASPWWSGGELHALRAALETVKRRYNVDENRVVLSGVSDGGTGAYYAAMRDTTPYASFLPLNGFWGVLANSDLGIDTPLHANNLRNKPFFIVNGERDPLYPTSIVDPAVAHYRTIGVVLDYLPQAGAGHNTRWWPEVKERADAFALAHPRDPLPDTLTWETSSGRDFNRAHWLVVDRLGSTPGDAALDDPNAVVPAPRLEFGIRTAGYRINRVVPGSNAETIGLRAGDALVRINGESPRAYADADEAFARLEPGASIALLVARDNAPVELSGVYNPKKVQDPPSPIFDRRAPSGRVDVVRSGNTVTARTRGVAAFTLLLSPDRFDFGKEVKVSVNGRTMFSGRVGKDVRTLQKWAAVDNDRTMLFAAELRIDVARQP